MKTINRGYFLKPIEATQMCKITPADLKGMSYIDIIRKVEPIALDLYERKYLTAKGRNKLIGYGVAQALKANKKYY